VDEEGNAVAATPGEDPGARAENGEEVKTKILLSGEEEEEGEGEGGGDGDEATMEDQNGQL
jgi:hypothetical protein